MDPLLDQEHRDLEEGLLRAGRDVGMSPALREKTLAALGMGAAGVAATAAVQSGSLSWLASKAAWLTTKGGALFSVSAVATAGAVAVAAVSGAFSESAPGDQVSVLNHETLPVESSKARAGDARDVSHQDTASPRDTDSPRSPASLQDTASLKDAVESDPSQAITPSRQGTAAEVPKSKIQQKSNKPEEAAQPPSVLREELSQISLVEAALREGKPARALKLLSDYRSSFPRPQLGLEAEVLTIQALYESGSVAAAGKRAQSFLDRHPQSPLGARAKQYLK